ncbi:MAG TPA: penicillin acylase family protein [Herpetosiphonaceae bacterium]
MLIRRLGKILGWIVLILLIVVLATGAGGYFYVRRSLPQVHGVVKVPGLSAPVEIRRDRDAVPHIYAQSRQDALFGLGFVHAQDRLWQMEFYRRSGQGRLSEILGDSTITADRFTRATGMHRAAQSAWEDLPEDIKVDVSAYVAGINALIDGGGTLPPEFIAMGHRPEPWTGADVMLWAKLLSWALGGAGIEDELFRSSLIDEVGPERAAQLIPDYAPDGLSILSPSGQPPHAAQQSWRESLATRELSGEALRSGNYEALIALDEQTRALLQLDDAQRYGVGSNNWVVSGAKSFTGKPLLANDPHLAATMPSRWYLAHLSGGDMDVIGATIPGLPAVVVGRNRTIAWGMSSNHVDSVDFFRERLDSTGTMAEFQGQMEPMTIITETIKVKGGADVQVPVRITRHGPLLSDAIVANRRPGSLESQLPPLEPLAMQWIGLMEGDKTVGAFLKLNRAQNWEAFQDALRDYDGPSQNFIYADTEGNIGFYLPGRLPTRMRDTASIPVEGWSGAYEWTGWVPFEELPHSYNPPEHFIVTANNRPFDRSYPYFLGRGWLIPYRAERIMELITSKDTFSLDDFATMQGDTVSIMARQTLPELLKLATPKTEQERQAIALLRDWNYDMRGDSAAAAIFAAWIDPLPRTLVEDELGPRLGRRWRGGIENYVGTFVASTLRERDNPWCDNAKTQPREDCAAVVNEALSAAIQHLTQKMGNDLSTWRWDRVHSVVFGHQPFTATPVLESLLDRRIGHGGTWGTVNIGNPALEANFDQFQSASYRQLVDLSSTQNDRFIIAIGQSGNPLSPHYDDYLDDWHAVRYRSLRLDREVVDRDQQALLRLEP